MATEKAIKLRKDAQHQELVNGIKALLASQAYVAEAVREFSKKLDALEERSNRPEGKEKRDAKKSRK